MFVISLSTIPPRFDRIGPTLQSLLAQTAAVDKILLYIPKDYRRFSDWDGSLPKVPDGIEIRRTDVDLGPATKVLAAARDFEGQDCDILFCDDDHVYAPGWAQGFLDLKRKHPGCCIAQSGLQAHWLAGGNAERALQPRGQRRWRSTDIEFQLRYLWQDLRAGRNRAKMPEPPRRVHRRSGYVDIFEGLAGVLVRPEYFDAKAFDIPAILWSVDDVWLSGMVARKNIPIWLQANILGPRPAQAHKLAALHDAVLDGVDRDTADRMAVEYLRETYGIW